MSLLSAFFFATSPAIAQLQLLEIAHPAFSATYHFTRSILAGVVVTHEGGVGPFVYTYMPMSIKPVGSGNDMDQQIEVSIGDVGTVLPAELDSVANANKMTIKPTITYREYKSDDLTLPLYGPFVFQIDRISFNRSGATTTAKAAAFNKGRVGLYYTLSLFPMLKGT